MALLLRFIRASLRNGERKENCQISQSPSPGGTRTLAVHNRFFTYMKIHNLMAMALIPNIFIKAGKCISVIFTELLQKKVRCYLR